MSAYVCWPNWGSEPSVGWELLRAAAQKHDVILMTQSRNIPAIAKGLEIEHISSVEFVGISAPSLLSRFEGRFLLGHLDYILWQVRARRAALATVCRVDVAHHVTFGNDWLPCALHFIKDVPVIWGPVGGSAPVPWQLIRFMSWRGRSRETVREIITRSARAVTATLVRRQGCQVVAVNTDTARRFHSNKLPVLVEPHVAMPPCMNSDGARASFRENSQRRLLFAARLTSWKGPYLALETLKHLPSVWTIDIYGRGPEELALRRHAARLGLGDRVHFRGLVPIENLRLELANADALLFPSMHDASPFTVAEAVRLGCPVVCLDVGGPPLLIQGSNGIAVKADWRAPRRLAAAVLESRRGGPSDRWNTDRLRDILDQWYCAATG